MQRGREGKGENDVIMLSIIISKNCIKFRRGYQTGFQTYYNATETEISWSHHEESKNKAEVWNGVPETGNILILGVERNTSSADQCGVSA